MTTPREHYGRWHYGDAGDRIPVDYGDLWRVGPHIFACGDLQRDSFDRLWNIVGRPDVTYVDPPWDASNLGNFRTKARTRKKGDFRDFLRDLVRHLSVTQLLVASEMGLKTTLLLEQEVSRNRGVVLDRFEFNSHGRHAKFRANLVLWTYGKPESLRDDVKPEAARPMHGESGLATPGLFIDAFTETGALVYDPCTGQGLIPTAAVERGRLACGNELHPRRLAVTLDKLAALTGEKPEKIGEL